MVEVLGVVLGVVLDAVSEAELDDDVVDEASVLVLAVVLGQGQRCTPHKFLGKLT